MRIEINKRLLKINLAFGLGNILLSNLFYSETKKNITNNNNDLYYLPIESLIKNYDLFDLNLDNLLQFRIFENNFHKNTLTFFYNGIGSLVIPKIFLLLNFLNSFKIFFESKVLENNLNDEIMKNYFRNIRKGFYYVDIPVLQNLAFIGGFLSFQIIF